MESYEEELSDSQLLKACEEEMEEEISDSQLLEVCEEGTPSKRARLDEEYQQRVGMMWDQLANPTPEFVPLDGERRDDPFQSLFDDLLENQSGGGGGGGDNGDNGDTFHIEKVLEKNCKKFHTTSKEYKVQVNLQPRDDAREAVMATLGVIVDIVDHVKRDNETKDSDQMRLIIDGNHLDYPIQMPFMPVDELTPDRVLRNLEAVVQSKREFFLNGEMTVLVYHVRNVEGRGLSKVKRFYTRKQEEPLAWIKTLASRGWAVVCGGMQEATAHFLHYRQHGVKHNKDSKAYQTSVQWVENQVRPTAAEALPLLLERLNDMLRRQKGFRVVVLDWENDDRPYFVGQGDESEVMYLYKMKGSFHLLLHPNKIRHVDSHQGFCRKCFFFFYSVRKTAHVCGEKNRDPLSQMSGGSHNRSVRCDAIHANDLVNTKTSVVTIVDSDENPGGGGCAFRAIATAIWLAQNPDCRSCLVPELIVKEESEEWCRRAGLTWGPCGLKELTQLQNVLKEDGIRLHVYYHDKKCIGFAGPWEEFAPTGPQYDIYLFHHDEHYDVIRSMTGFLGRSYYCFKCDVGYESKQRHKCHSICRCCSFSKDQCLADEEKVQMWTTCDRCHRVFKGEQCYNNHLQRLPHGGKEKERLVYSTCERYQKCTDCNKVIDLLAQKKISTFRHPERRNLDDHVCGEVYCAYCKKTGPKHWCYIQPVFDQKCKGCQQQVTFPHQCLGGPVTTYEEQTEVRYLFFDVETMPLEEVHEVNLVVAHKVCSQCLHDETIACDVCQDRRRVFHSRDAFCQWLFRPEHRGFTVMAHNFKGYDSYFLLEYMCARGERPEVTFRGAKLLYMFLERLDMKFKDSLCFLPMALRKFSKTFGLEEEKGHFPHFFNRPENQNYVGPFPPIEDYGLKCMRPKEAQELRTWYADQQGKTFDFQKELEYYCEKDVELLKRGVLEARRIFLDTSGFDPFHECITTASACMHAFRRNFMPHDSIGIIPREGYRGLTQQSCKAKRWLYWLQKTQNLHLQTCLSREGEKVLLGAPVDGYDATTNTVYQFHGCYWHACPVCFPAHHAFPEKQGFRAELSQKYYDTQRRTMVLRAAGYTVVEMWEHDWDRLDLSTPDWLSNSDPLRPRDGLFGGRTNALQLYYEAQEGESIHYVDFTSLYPSVMKNGGAFPIGHPEIVLPSPHDSSLLYVEDYYGLNKVKVLPPRDLYIPVLPIHLNGKLMFVLCRTCAEKLDQTSKCRHNCEERALVGVWTTPELKKALQLGYKILDVYEIWHYPRTSTTLFKEYVQTYLQMKQEASGWPTWCKTPEDRQRYLSDYEAHEGIRLCEDRIEVNPGLRADAKNKLNNLWGKFAQNPALPKTEYVDSAQRFAELMFNGRADVKHLLLINDEMVQMQFDEKEEFIQPSNFANVVIGNFVTSFARLRLYEMLEQVQERVLYFDTDSLIYVTGPEDTPLPLGDYLGDLTSELAPGDSIQTFVSTGPKSYGFQTRQGHTEIKCKGIPLNMTSSQKVNFESMVSLVHGTETEIRVTLPHHIRRDPRLRQLKTVELEKIFQVVYDKRIRRGMKTVPYGYIEDPPRTQSCKNATYGARL